LQRLARRSRSQNLQDCKLNSARGDIKHVIYIQFDNTHLRRDIPNVPSDLEQMPHLLDFIRGNGTLLANDHTVLILPYRGGHTLPRLTGVLSGPPRPGRVEQLLRATSTTGRVQVPELVRYWTGPVLGDQPRRPFPT